MYRDPPHVRAALDPRGFVEEIRLERAAREPPSLPTKHRQYNDTISSTISTVSPPSKDLTGAYAKPTRVTREAGEEPIAKSSTSRLLDSRDEPGFSTEDGFPTKERPLPKPPSRLNPDKHGDRIALLEEQMEDLRVRRSKVDRFLSDLSNAAPPNPLTTDFMRARLLFEEELDEIRLEEHQVGLKLHRASKRRREIGEFGDTITWVGQRHPTFTDIKVPELGIDHTMLFNDNRSQHSEPVQPYGLDGLSTAPQSSEIPPSFQTDDSQDVQTDPHDEAVKSVQTRETPRKSASNASAEARTSMVNTTEGSYGVVTDSPRRSSYKAKDSLEVADELEGKTHLPDTVFVEEHARVNTSDDTENSTVSHKDSEPDHKTMGKLHADIKTSSELFRGADEDLTERLRNRMHHVLSESSTAMPLDIQGSSSASANLTDRPLHFDTLAVAPINLDLAPSASAPLTERGPDYYGWSSQHIVLGPADEEMLEVCSTLGQGSLGIVEEVRCKDTQLPTFVRKRVKLPFRNRKNILQIIQEEAKNLKALAHPHVVTLIGSYEERRHNNRHFYCLLMSPVGENELREFLEIYGEQDPMPQGTTEWSGWLRRWFVCLASALSYMHDQGIRHQDIKPSNIVHKGNRIFFTDFSSSSTFEVGHTTSTENPSRSSPMYAAPEISSWAAGTGGMRRHGRSSDIFALGCVFCDMLNVWQGRSLSDFHDYLAYGDGTTTGPFRYSDRVDLITAKLQPSTLLEHCILPMLSTDRSARPTAAETMRKILSLDVWWGMECECIESHAENGHVLTV